MSKKSFQSRAEIIKKMQNKTPAEPPAPELQESVETSPEWAMDSCKACEGSGYNSRGNPCQICVKKSGVKPPVKKEIAAAVPAPAPTVAASGSVAAKIAAKKKAAAMIRERAKNGTSSDVAPAPATEVPAVEVPIVEVPVEEVPAVEVPAVEEVTEKSTKKKTLKGFALCINCAPVKGNGKVVLLDDILEELRKEMAQDMSRESFYDIDVFVRRDALAKVAPGVIAEYASGKILVAMGVGTACTDIKIVVDALRGIAKSITVGAGA